MEGIRPPAPLLATPGKPLTSWSAWLSDFEVYAMAIGWTDWGEQRRQALLLHCVGQEARRLFRAECPTGVPSQGGVEPKFEGRAATMSLVDATVDVLSRLFEKKSDVITERVLFRKCTQGQTTVRTFLANLRERSQRCAFGALEDEMIRDQFLEGCSSARLRERLCREDDLTLPRLEVVALAEDQALERQQAVGRLQTAAAEREHAPVSVAATATKRYAHGTRSMTPLSRRKVGHFWRCCPKKGEKTAGEKPVASVQVLSVAVTSPTEDTRPYIQLKVAEFTAYLRRVGVQHVRVTPYHPRGAGAVERMNRVVKSALQTASKEKQDWSQAVRQFLRTYRSTPHATTGLSPSEMLHGRQLRTMLHAPTHPPGSLSWLDHRRTGWTVEHWSTPRG
ncbi:uncharacterized protein LOC122392644 isoform X3 [Amphibalanus amphitrite]|uniref:uncharacterized protein LOC122392644 isoform X3 n=1 Tax=Amphibalanus amphitrite TaxID=1232801 RepID=UPI001C90F595|nr:uncharacterized protein LOC122392644 isoform X3 [Amphibalanus amphitrite]